MGRKTDIKNIEKIKESSTGRNEKFRNKNTGKEYTAKQLVKEIVDGKVVNAHVRNINGIDTPCSNPDGNKDNNLG